MSLIKFTTTFEGIITIWMALHLLLRKDKRRHVAFDNKTNGKK